MRAAIRTVVALVGLASVALLLLSASVADAQQLCAARDAAVAKLEGQFDEQVVARGLAKSGEAMVELFVSETGTWTALVTDVNGRSCIVASGKSWTELPLLFGDPA